MRSRDFYENVLFYNYRVLLKFMNKFMRSGDFYENNINENILVWLINYYTKPCEYLIHDINIIWNV